MNAIARAAHAYHRANVRAWQSLRRSPGGGLALFIGMYLAITLGLHAAGHTEAAWIATVALGAPLLVAGWAT